MSDKLYEVSPECGPPAAYVDAEGYQAMYRESIENPGCVLGGAGDRIDWIKPFTKVKNTTFDPDEVSIRWFEDGTTQRRRTTASTGTSRRAATRSPSSGRATTRPNRRSITYRQLHDEVCRFANVLPTAASRRATASRSTCR